MRVDKFLWAIRVFKTRTLATAHCKAGKVLIETVKVKPSRVLKMGEKIIVIKRNVFYEYEVIAFPRSRVGAKLVPDYSNDITAPEELEKLDMLRAAEKEFRWKGLGRPTKKDRRNLDKYKDL